MSTAAVAVPNQDRVSIIEFIYTSCPSLCQSAGADMFRLSERLKAAGLSDRIALYSVSFDPQFDTPARLADYAQRHRADGILWTVVRPRERDVDRILREFEVIVLPDGIGGYVHNISVHVVSPIGKIVGIHDTDNIDGILASTRRALSWTRPGPGKLS